MGSLDQVSGSGVRRQIKVVNITGMTPAQIETAFNDTWGAKGWRIVQVFPVGANLYLLAERSL